MKKLLFKRFLFDSADLAASVGNNSMEFNLYGIPNKYSAEDLTEKNLSEYGAKFISIDKHDDEYDISFSLDLSKFKYFSCETKDVDDFDNEESFLLWREMQ